MGPNKDQCKETGWIKCPGRTPLEKRAGMLFKRSVTIFWSFWVLTFLFLPSKSNFRSLARDIVVVTIVSGD